MKALKVILGLLLIILGIGGIYLWRQDLLTLLKGTIGIIVLFAGIVALAMAKE